MENFLATINEFLQGVGNYQDSYTEKHETMTGKLMFHFGKVLGYTGDELCQLSLLGNVHDIGKILIPVSILEDCDPLNSFERSIISLHPQIGAQIVGKIKHPFSDMAKIIIFNHHEAFDGTGYPNGIKGSKIPIQARICSICDVYDALRSHRPYRNQEYTHEKIIEKMLDKRYTLRHKFDPELIAVFEKISDHFETWYDEGISSNSFN